jgi:molybdopterin/thiamine biosynthesis adenylyltransferase
VDPYVRQRALAGFGADAQEALASARVAIVGVGGLGCPVAMYLAAAGVGHLTLIDGDHVSVTNLHRQILFGPDDVGRPKVEVATEALARLSPSVDVTALHRRIGHDAERVLADHDLIVDGTDSWPSRFAVNDAALALNLPLVWGAVSGWFGQVTVFEDGHSLRDLFREESVDAFAACDGGVLGPLCGQVGAAMATEAVVRLAGVGPGVSGNLHVIDAREGVWRSVPLGMPALAGRSNRA